MKLSLILMGSTFAEGLDDGVARFDYSASYGDYEYVDYIDDLGNKRQKKVKKNKKDKYNSYTAPDSYGSDPSGSDSYGSDPYNYNTGWNTGYAATYGSRFSDPGDGKGVDSDDIGNGRYCWNCRVALRRYTPAENSGVPGYFMPYDKCFESDHGFIEMCVGEEYFCSWEERRHKGIVVAVLGGCKAPEACFREWIQNFHFEVYTPTSPMLKGDQCKAGNLRDSDHYADSVCRWCCDALTTTLDRFNPLVAQLCNHKDFGSANPANSQANNGIAFVWNSAGDLFNGLQDMGQLHSMFMIHRQYALGMGAATLPVADMTRMTGK